MIDKIITTPKKMPNMMAFVKITFAAGGGAYAGNLTYLSATFSVD